MKTLEFFINNEKIKEEEFVKVIEVNKDGENLINFTIEVESDESFFAYADINSRVLDCKVNEVGNKIFVEFSIMTSEIENLENFDLYFVTENGEKYHKLFTSLK